jgi:hypothetical protein
VTHGIAEEPETLERKADRTAKLRPLARAHEMRAGQQEPAERTRQLAFLATALGEALSEARLSVLDAQAEIQHLREQLAAVQTVEALRTRLVKRPAGYYVRAPEGDAEEGPYCPRCYEMDTRLRPVLPVPTVFAAFGAYRCLDCKSFY